MQQRRTHLCVAILLRVDSRQTAAACAMDMSAAAASGAEQRTAHPVALVRIEGECARPFVGSDKTIESIYWRKKNQESLSVR